MLAVEDVKSVQPLVVDASGQVLGRLASNVAKSLLEGRFVVVVNAEKAVISGSKRNIMEEQLKRLEITSKVNPVYTPHHPKRPDGMLRRVVRGMLPRRKPKGLAAFRRLRIYIDTPAAYRSVEKKVFEDAKARRPLSSYTTLGEVALKLGWSVE